MYVPAFERDQMVSPECAFALVQISSEQKRKSHGKKRKKEEDNIPNSSKICNVRKKDNQS
jgi:hypothetical protein